MIETPQVPAMTDEPDPHEAVAQTIHQPNDDNSNPSLTSNNTEDNNSTPNTPVKEEPSNPITMMDYDSFPVDAKGEVIIPADVDVEAFFTVVDADDDQHDCGICGKKTLDEHNLTYKQRYLIRFRNQQELVQTFW